MRYPYPKLLSIVVFFVFAVSQVAMGARGRPTLNAARTSLVADTGQLLRGPATGTEYGGSLSLSYIQYIASRGCNAVHLYAEDFVSGYAPGSMSNDVDQVVAMTRTNGIYLIITIANSWANGSNSLSFATNFWSFYSARYANETHVLFEIFNEPVAWGPPYSAANANPPGALNMEEACYKIIRANAPNTPVLLFTYSVLGGSGGASAALTDIQAFNTNVFGNANAVWTNEVVAFHGYAGPSAASNAVAQIIAAGYPCFMTEFAGSIWGTGAGALDIYEVANLERLGVSWLDFQFGTGDEGFKDVVNWSGLSWKPDFGNWPPVRGPYGNAGYPWTIPDYTNHVLTGSLRIEAENFDSGGEAVACHMTNTVKTTLYRTNEVVPIEMTSDPGGGYDVTGTAAGEWLEYTIYVSEPGYYNLALRVAGTAAGSVQFLAGGINGTNLTGAWTVPVTGGAQTWTTITNTVFLTPGQQVLHLGILAGGFNLNWLQLSPITTGILANGSYKLLNGASGLAVTAVSSSNLVDASSYIGSTDQQWTLQNLGGGEYEISCADGGYSLVSGSGYGYWWVNYPYILQPAGGGYCRLLAVGSGYCFETTPASRTAIDEAVSAGSISQQWAIVVPAAPAFPNGLNAVAAGSAAANLIWNAVTGATGYNVKRATTSGGPYTTVATGVVTTSYTDTGLSAGVKYYYVVSAVSGGLESLNSAEAGVARLWTYLAFDETGGTTAIDSTGNGRNGTLVNGPVRTAGLFGNAVDLSGTNQYVSLPSGVVNGLTNFTIAGWINLDAASTWTRVFDFGSGTTKYMFLTANAGSAVRFAITTGGSGGEQQINGTSALPTSTWTHFAVTLNGGTGTLYVNGVVVGSNPGMTLAPASLGATTQNYLGKSQYSDPYLNGRVDDFRIYADALSASDVANLYACQVPPIAPAGLTAIPVSASQINLFWNAFTNATSYKVKRATTSGGPYTSVANGVTATNYTDSGLAGGTVYYYTVSAVVSGSETLNSPQAMATTFSPTQGSLAHRYSFSETSGTNVADSIGGPAWNGTLPNGGTWGGGQVQLAAAHSQYVQLPAGIVSNNTAVTVELWATFPSTLPAACFLFGFGNSSGNSGENYIFCQPANGRIALTATNWSGEQNTLPNPSGNWSGLTNLHVTAIFNPPQGRLALYTNGVLAAQNTSVTIPMSSVNDLFSYIGRSLYSGDSYFDFNLDEFRLYNQALSSSEIAGTHALGPNQLLSTNSPPLGVALAGTNLSLSWPLANAGYTVQVRTNLALGQWENLAAPAPQMVGGQWMVTLPSSPSAITLYRLSK